jgi:16S rRNA (uracil1498-N3)-methyltransferase
MGERSFFVEPGAILGQRAEIGGQTAHQIARVLRLRPGDTIELLDNSGYAYVTRIAEIRRDAVTAEVVDRHKPGTEPRVHVELYQALLKGQKMEWVLQKGTEIGVGRFVPVLSERCVSRPTKTDLEERLNRWRAIVREAAEQSGRAILPDVAGLESFERACVTASGAGLAIMAWEEEKAAALGEVLREVEPKAGNPRVAILIGPEGGFSEQEAKIARGAGMRIAGLGPRTLRAETAALVAATVALWETGGLGG